jgi:hypothetical protein
MVEIEDRKYSGKVKKATSYWQFVLCTGLPFVLLYRAVDYGRFYLTTHRFAPGYPWRFVLLLDVPIVFFVAWIAQILDRRTRFRKS